MLAPVTEDENSVTNSSPNGQLHPFPNHLLSKLEEDTSTVQSASPALARSYVKLEKAVPPNSFKPGAKDKWHEWFQIQADWMRNVEEDPEHYFDDYL